MSTLVLIAITKSAMLHHIHLEIEPSNQPYSLLRTYPAMSDIDYMHTYIFSSGRIECDIVLHMSRTNLQLDDSFVGGLMPIVFEFCSFKSPFTAYQVHNVKTR
ncbi:unnamed protein product [Periconia digitata]|uniref:Uncharacterized protein n=1 Tax=Periconia digitata TaxID=1303443 RepID=A0A9W4UH57_9PLEO|nr:unnamed protein product [Periconia digitata]